MITSQQAASFGPVMRVAASAGGGASAVAPGIGVSARGLHKCYGQGSQQHHALLGVDMDIHRGEIVGVLGPNGAGKTTLVSILEGLVRADAGTATVLGEDPGQPEAMARIKPRFGVSMQNSVLPPLLTVGELLEFKQAMHAMPRKVTDLLQSLGLEAKRDTQYRHLSGGEQQRVVVAMALIGDPELLFLDEPTSQLDPQARRAVWDLLVEQRRRRDASILVTTHQMEEAERLCDRVLVLDHGRVIAEGPPRKLIAAHCPERHLEFATAAGSDLGFLSGVERLEPRNDGLVPIRVRKGRVEADLAEVLARQGRGELVAEDLHVAAQTLEDVFIKLTGRGIRA
jgi:ABC-2 type transport system ATP-binding protein